MSIVGASVLQALGDGLRRLAGPLLPPMVEALVAPLEEASSLVRPPVTGRPGPALVDLAVSPYPRQLGQLVGVNVPAGLSVTAARAMVTGRGVSRRGTPTAIIAAARATLTGTKAVLIIERDGSPYRLTVITYEAETPDPARTAAAALTEKPMGLQLTHQVRRGITWGEVDQVQLTWRQARARGITWDELGLTLPEQE